MKTTNNKLSFIFFFGLFLNTCSIHSQPSNKTSVLNWFDQEVSKETLPISNGKLHLNFDRKIENSNRYYISDKSTRGNIEYDFQDYSELNLKYDLYEDELVLSSQGESGLIDIILIKDKTQYFTLDNKKFVNLDANNLLPENLRGGYYEENLVSKNFTFYIKHYKKRNEVIKGNGIFINYAYKNDFLLFTQGKFYNINSKSELLKIFPNDKNKINDYYAMNSNLRKENTTKFLENLMKYISKI